MVRGVPGTKQVHVTRGAARRHAGDEASLVNAMK